MGNRRRQRSVSDGQKGRASYWNVLQLAVGTTMTKKQTIFRISFLHQGEVYEIFARSVSQGGMFGFVEIEDILFGERSKLLIDSSEERLKTEFEGVQRTYVPLHSVLRIDEVEKAGRGRITSGDGKVAAFPMAIMPQGGKSGKS